MEKLVRKRNRVEDKEGTESAKIEIASELNVVKIDNERRKRGG